MLKDIVLKQKSEKERLLSLPYIKRAKSVEAKKWMDSDLIKVVLGPRRAGKSVFSLMLLSGRSFMYFNFDDEGILEQSAFDYDELMRQLHSAYGDIKTILFDEIQNLPKWEIFANRLHREGYNLILTGSNANLLSKELATALTGRHIPIEILPFSFKEFLLAKQFETSPDAFALPEIKGKFFGLLEKYIAGGGFPEVVMNDLDSKGYLNVLFDSLMFKDVVKRHKIRFADDISNLGSYLINNIANLYSLRKLANALEFRSGVTLEKYLRYLIEAYLIFSLRRYSPKTAERLKSPQKIYAVDNGFIGAKAVQFSPNYGKIIENLVFIEFIKRGLQPNKELFYYQTRNSHEIDFVIKKELKIVQLAQVCDNIENTDTKKREIKALLEAGLELNCDNLIIINSDIEKEENFGGQKIKFVLLWKWLIE